MSEIELNVFNLSYFKSDGSLNVEEKDIDINQIGILDYDKNLLGL